MVTVAERSHPLTASQFSGRHSGLQLQSASGQPHTLQTPRFLNRSSAGQTLSTQRSAKNSLLAIFQGRSPVVTGVGGNSGARSSARVQAMHNGGNWELYRNGAFRFTPRGLGTLARTDLFPIVGRFSARNGVVSFSGTRRSGNLTSRNFATVRGAFSLRTGSARVVQQTSIANAAFVNGGRFGSNSNSVVALNLRMVRIR